MYINYTRLWKLLVDKKLKKKDLALITGLSSSTISKLSTNQNVNTEVLVKICYALQCDISDIAEIVITEDNR
ncbi:MAG: helix-turn-helix transcriptional regulator [Eubacterium sp.]|nr:helix-turn-helix transcriptional regulator [Eubacterium sp.]